MQEGANDLGILALTQGSEYQGLPAQSRSHDPGGRLVKGNELEQPRNQQVATEHQEIALQPNMALKHFAILILLTCRTVRATRNASSSVK